MGVLDLNPVEKKMITSHKKGYVKVLILNFFENLLVINVYFSHAAVAISAGKVQIHIDNVQHITQLTNHE